MDKAGGTGWEGSSRSGRGGRVAEEPWGEPTGESPQWRSQVASTLSLLRAAAHEGELELRELRQSLAASLLATNEALRRDILAELVESRRRGGSLGARLAGLELRRLRDDRAQQRLAAQLAELRRQLAALSGRLEGVPGPLGPPGRLLWRIDGFRGELQRARGPEPAPLLSPAFLHSDFGYRLRLELHLNGLGQWRGRHVIGCLRVLDGQWDPLLEWPCVVRADVVLRDQLQPANDLGKSVKAVKRGRAANTAAATPHLGSDLYMFIPHATLFGQPGYTNGDLVFLDVRVKHGRFNGSTASLV